MNRHLSLIPSTLLLVFAAAAWAQAPQLAVKQAPAQLTLEQQVALLKTELTTTDVGEALQLARKLADLDELRAGLARIEPLVAEHETALARLTHEQG